MSRAERHRRRAAVAERGRYAFRAWHMRSHLWIPVGWLAVAVRGHQLKAACLTRLIDEALSASSDCSVPLWLGQCRRKTPGGQPGLTPAATCPEPGGVRGEEGTSCCFRPSTCSSPVSEECAFTGTGQISGQSCFDALLSVCDASNGAWDAQIEELFCEDTSADRFSENSFYQILFCVWTNLRQVLASHLKAARESTQRNSPAVLGSVETSVYSNACAPALLTGLLGLTVDSVSGYRLECISRILTCARPHSSHGNYVRVRRLLRVRLRLPFVQFSIVWLYSYASCRSSLHTHNLILAGPATVELSYACSLVT